jgi:hypothetical protein
MRRLLWFFDYDFEYYAAMNYENPNKPKEKSKTEFSFLN